MSSIVGPRSLEDNFGALGPLKGSKQVNEVEVDSPIEAAENGGASAVQCLW